ncbi:NADAR family protein [Candidatus Dojkabacteria bacterium]|jgi:hypothetical protein|nr:NADAR family protein [Candidatus Dojkabacteria bacterium]
MNEEYTFFSSGVFSQWYPSKFVVDNVEFSCAEQFMMYQKAILFGDHHTSQQIMKTTNPKTQKLLGRKVSGFDPKAWHQNCFEIVYIGNEAKFTQNPTLLARLMATGTTILVEASSWDKIWGIGLDAKTAIVTPPYLWKGSNYLGKVLTSVRNNIREDMHTEEILL